MKEIKAGDLINISLFQHVEKDGFTKEQIKELYPSRKNGAYYLNKFENYLKDTYSINLRDYCINDLNINWPKCPISNELLGYKITGKGLLLSKFKKGCVSKKFCPKFAESCKRISISRMGEGNPMFGIPAWNKGKDKRNPIIKKISEQRKGIKFSEITKMKQSESAKIRLVNGHTGHKHSLKTIQKLREKTSALWASGRFNRISSIHLKTREFLQTLNLKEHFQEEYQVKYFSMDFAFPNNKIAIECQGTYFHVDPRIYPNGPRDAIQRRNFGRDKNKINFCKKLKWQIIPLWETEINDGSFKEILLCELSKLNLLNQ